MQHRHELVPDDNTPPYHYDDIIKELAIPEQRNEQSMSPVATIRLVATIVAVVVASVSAADTKLHGLRPPPPLRSAAVAAVCGKHFPCRAAVEAFPTHAPTTPPSMSKEVSKALQLYSYSSAETSCEDAYCWLKKLVGGALWYLLILFFMVLIPFSFIKGCGF